MHPTQLYSTFNALLIAAALVCYFTMNPAPGRVFALMLILKGLTRFLLEMLRAEPVVIGSLSFSMLVGAILFVLGGVMWVAMGLVEQRKSAGRPALASGA